MKQTPASTPNLRNRLVALGPAPGEITTASGLALPVLEPLAVRPVIAADPETGYAPGDLALISIGLPPTESADTPATSLFGPGVELYHESLLTCAIEPVE